LVIITYISSRVLSTFLGTGSDSLFELMGPTEETYAAAYETLTLGRPISCAITGTIFEPALAPTIVIMDVRLTITYDF